MIDWKSDPNAIYYHHGSQNFNNFGVDGLSTWPPGSIRAATIFDRQVLLLGGGGGPASLVPWTAI